MAKYNELSVKTLVSILSEATSFTTSSWYEGRGIMHRVHYPNGYGASIVKHDGSYGCKSDLWEVAVLDGDGLCYSTPITDDVIGYASDEEVSDICRRIRRL